MADVCGYDFEPDAFFYRTLSVEALEELFPVSTMQLDQCSSSQDTSSPAANTPRSSTDLQGDVRSPGRPDDSHGFHHEGLTTDPFSYMGGATGATPPDLTDMDMSEFDDISFSQHTIHDGFVEVTQNTQSFPLQQQHFQSQTPSAVQGGYTEFNAGHNLVWPSPMLETMPFMNQDIQAPYNLNSFVSPTSTSSTTTMPNQVPGYTLQSGPISPEGATSGTFGTTMFRQMPIRSPSGATPRAVSMNNTQARTVNHPGRSVSRPSNRVYATPYPLPPGPNVPSQTGTQDSRAPLKPATIRTAIEQSSAAVVASSPESMVSSQSREVKRGGRKCGLDYETREKVNQMRKVGVCWVCAIQRDKCDLGQPCGRCLIRSQRGQQHLLPCIRTHLSDLVKSFLTLTMTGQHRKEETISFVNDNVKFWHGGSGIPVHLTCIGLGHFTWDLHEFEPSSPDVMFQRRVVLSNSGTWKAIDKRSPPLACKNFTELQAEKLEKYVEEVIEDYLDQFQEDCFAAEEDGASFQTDLLKALCSLYLNLPGQSTDKNLKGDVRQVIKMLVITCIMDRAITIVDERQDSIIRRMRNYNDPRIYTEWTSPMIANRQLKHFFSKMRDQQYSQTLNKLQQILRTAQDKSKRWMSSFVLMLGIALVLEQCQHMLWIKAEKRVAKNECTKHDAEFDARGACRGIDDAFEFLCKLYHCKYRGKHRKMTRFSEWSSKVNDPAEAAFARSMSELVDRDSGYLYYRQGLEVNGMEEKSYSSRLLSKFLVDLFGLDRASP